MVVVAPEDSAHEPPPIVVGMLVAARIAYFAVASPACVLHLDDPLDRIVPTPQLDRPEVIADFRDRVAQEFRRLRPAAVGVAFTRRYMGWNANDAFDRFSLDTAAMLAAVDLGIRCERVRQEDAADAVGVAPAKLGAQAAARLGIDRTRYWNDRVWAIATAVYMARRAS
jgi:hypothetical protein